MFNGACRSYPQITGRNSAFSVYPENFAPCCDHRIRAHRSVVAVRWSHSVSKRRDNRRVRPPGDTNSLSPVRNGGVRSRFPVQHELYHTRRSSFPRRATKISEFLQSRPVVAPIETTCHLDGHRKRNCHALLAAIAAGAPQVGLCFRSLRARKSLVGASRMVQITEEPGGSRYFFQSRGRMLCSRRQMK
jgi:hypothetical protein